ncbi:flavin reductase family protein [Mesorhizobium shangrilense]|uniref:Flavin reductase family protein n=1 Tax=Mesorhizobium shangrilense TaxID=460060 RepID=A0ABV2DGV3_9HYPH
MTSSAISPAIIRPDLLRDQFVAAMSRVPLSVAVVVAGAPEHRLALTVGTFISVSADPPMVLVSVKASSPLCKAVSTHRRYVINVLSAEQVEHSERFSGRPRTGRPYDLTAARWTGVPGEPLRYLEGVVAAFDCELVEAQPIASHVLLIGRVDEIILGAERPLVYWSRSYGIPSPLSGAV